MFITGIILINGIYDILCAFSILVNINNKNIITFLSQFHLKMFKGFWHIGFLQMDWCVLWQHCLPTIHVW